jgi:antitoxin PrlF
VTRRQMKRTIANAKISAKRQVTIPLSIRKRLTLKPGDTVVFEESDKGSILIRRAAPLDIALLSSVEETLPEWNSENDERAYRDL